MQLMVWAVNALGAWAQCKMAEKEEDEGEEGEGVAVGMCFALLCMYVWREGRCVCVCFALLYMYRVLRTIMREHTRA